MKFTEFINKLPSIIIGIIVPLICVWAYILSYDFAILVYAVLCVIYESNKRQINKLNKRIEKLEKQND